MHLYFCTGTKSRAWVIDVNGLRASIGEEVASALLGIHAITGWGSTSSFKWHGKKAAYQVLQSKPTLCGALQHLGSQWHIPADLLVLREEFVCALYRPVRSPVNNINELRYQLFTAKAAQTDHLLSTQDALHLHLQQANYQAVIWSRDLEAKRAVPTALDHGWQLVDSVLTI